MISKKQICSVDNIYDEVKEKVVFKRFNQIIPLQDCYLKRYIESETQIPIPPYDIKVRLKNDEESINELHFMFDIDEQEFNDTNDNVIVFLWEHFSFLIENILLEGLKEPIFVSDRVEWLSLCPKDSWELVDGMHRLIVLQYIFKHYYNMNTGEIGKFKIPCIEHDESWEGGFDKDSFYANHMKEVEQRRKILLKKNYDIPISLNIILKILCLELNPKIPKRKDK